MIHSALRADLRLRAEAAAGTAEVATAIYRAHGVKSAQPKLFNPAAVALYHLEAVEKIRPRSARLFLELLDRGQLPSWVLSAVDLDLIRAAAQ